MFFLSNNVKKKKLLAAILIKYQKLEKQSHVLSPRRPFCWFSIVVPNNYASNLLSKAGRLYLFTGYVMR